MAKKRKTLPKNFEEIIAQGNITEMKAIFDKCEINAYGGYWKGNALSFHGISGEFIRWFVEQGGDINYKDTFGNTPICAQAEDDNGNLEILLELGADIEAGGNYIHTTPLYTATGRHNVKMIKSLIANGANVNSKNGYKEETPLEGALISCTNASIVKMAYIADILLKAGAVTTPKMSEYVERIGKTFEFYRYDFNQDFLEETEKALMHLYKLFNVEPVAKKKFYDGISPIKVGSTIWQKQFNELWERLVPARGNASTVQGEVIRICGKISREILDKHYQLILGWEIY